MAIQPNPSYANFDRYYQEELGNLGFNTNIPANTRLASGFTYQQQASQNASDRILRDSLGSSNPQMSNPQSATISSQQFVNQPMVPPARQQNMGSNPFRQAASPVLGREQIAQGIQMPTLSQQQRENIRMQVQSEFAPQLERIQMGQAARDEQFGIQRAQRSAGTFGLGDREAAGRTGLQEQTGRELTQFEQALNAEVQQRIDAAEGRERQAFFDTQGLISQIQGQQMQQLSTLANLYNQDRQFGLQAQQQAAAQAGNTLDFISNLDDAGVQQLISTEGAGILNDLESSLGLPNGYIEQLRATKQRAAQAETQEEIQTAFNEATKTALATPAGQEFTLLIGGEPMTFTGQERDYQIVTASGGIFLVDKNNPENMQTLRQPTPSGSGSGSTKIPNLDPFFSQDGGFEGFFFQDPKTGLPQFTNQAGNQTIDPSLYGGSIRFGTPFSQNVNPLSMLGGDFVTNLIQQTALEVVKEGNI